MVKSLTLNPYMSLFSLKLCTHIWLTKLNINFGPPYIGLFGPSWSELSPYGLIGPPTDFFVIDEQKRDDLNRASQRVRGATKYLRCNWGGV